MTDFILGALFENEFPDGLAKELPQMGLPGGRNPS